MGIRYKTRLEYDTSVEHDINNNDPNTEQFVVRLCDLLETRKMHGPEESWEMYFAWAQFQYIV